MLTRESLTKQELIRQADMLQAVVEANLGEVVALGVSLDDYMATYAAQHCEYVEGVVINVAAASLEHNDLLYYLHRFLSTYFEIKPLGRVIGQPFVMRLPAFPNRRREPDLMVVLNSNPHALKSGYMDGPADICIEIVSEESSERDYGGKFNEYEQGGVGEYWLIDQLRKEAHFYKRNATDRYESQKLDANDSYHPAALPGLRVHVPTLWQTPLPGPAATAQAVSAMLNDA